MTAVHEFTKLVDETPMELHIVVDNDLVFAIDKDRRIIHSMHKGQVHANIHLTSDKGWRLDQFNNPIY